MESTEKTCWRNLIARCCNPNAHNYTYYGARGITVCDRWLKSYDDFLTDMGNKPSPEMQIDRINNNGNYEPGNCRWTTQTQNARNKRNNHIIHHGKCASEVAAGLGVTQYALRTRLYRGVKPDDAITIPFRRRSKTKLLLWNGKMSRAGALARKYGLTYDQLKNRLLAGWSLRQALLTPRLRGRDKIVPD